ncbi:MAG: fatty acid desaturase [Halioglobus sp.]|nr:fatty acid desaturase [Halioglobus sp.]
MGKVAKDATANQPVDLVEPEYLIPQATMNGLPDVETELFRRWRQELRDRSGQSYEELKCGLQPRYGWVWMQIFTAYMLIAVIGLGLVAVQPLFAHGWQSLLAGWIAGVLLGYLIAFIGLWLHEAAHYNLCARRHLNDRLANVFVGILLMHDVRSYRRIHFVHHRHLGEINDTERSYFYPLNLRYFIESLTGVKVFRVLLDRVRLGAAKSVQSVTKKDDNNWVSPMGVALHLGIIAGSIIAQQYALTFAWIFGALIFYPFFGALRPILEHRKFHADPACDYSKVPHGAYTRTFKPGLFSHTFGGAGFNRHLIHHWDPSVSCTCFSQVERFLQDSQLREFYLSRKTSYHQALLTLLRGG